MLERQCYNGVHMVVLLGLFFWGSFFGSLWKGLLRIALLLGKRPVHTECVSRDRALRHEQAADPSKERGLQASYNGVAAGGARVRASGDVYSWEYTRVQRSMQRACRER